MAVLHNGLAVQTFEAWVEFVGGSKREKDRMAAVGSKWINAAWSRAWRSWLDFAAEIRRQKLIAEKAAMKDLQGNGVRVDLPQGLRRQQLNQYWSKYGSLPQNVEEDNQHVLVTKEGVHLDLDEEKMESWGAPHPEYC